MSNEQMVSCLCVTRCRVEKLKRAITCFTRQTYAPRELVVVYESDDWATRDYLAGLPADASLRVVEVPALPKQTLGALRNIAVQAAQGHFVAQWDDDDWHSPVRLAEQVRALMESPYSACALMRWVLYDEITQQAYLSGPRAWEGSLVALREVLPPYAELAKGEDTPVLQQLMAQDKLVGLDSPHLYIYTYHGANVWGRAHWRKNLLAYAQVLAPDSIERVQKVLRGHNLAVDATALQKLQA
jgi:glycosyltransferase involved in cell wall biosynthesis